MFDPPTNSIVLLRVGSPPFVVVVVVVAVVVGFAFAPEQSLSCVLAMD